MKKLAKLYISAVGYDCFGDKIIEEAVVSAEAFSKAVELEESYRLGGTSYLTSTVEEAVARLLHVSACNFFCFVDRRVYKFN